MIIDCFPFFNELDLLEIRLHSLAQYVDRFVLTESSLTHSGIPKPLYFQENKDRYKDFNVTHVVVTMKDGMTPLDRDIYQRECLMQGLDGVGDDDIVLLSDLDEIPNMESYKPGTEGVMRNQRYYYYLNLTSGSHSWHGTTAIRKKNITTLERVRAMKNKRNILSRRGGWHFCYLGGAEDVVRHMQSFSHWQLNTEEVVAKMRNNRMNLRDPYHGIWWSRPERLKIEMPSGPGWLLENKDRYRELFIGDSV